MLFNHLILGVRTTFLTFVASVFLHQGNAHPLLLKIQLELSSSSSAPTVLLR